MTPADMELMEIALLKSRHAITLFARPGEHLLREEIDALEAIDEALAKLKKYQEYVL